MCIRRSDVLIKVGVRLVFSGKFSMAPIFDFGEFPVGLTIRFGSLEFSTDSQGKLSFTDVGVYYATLR